PRSTCSTSATRCPPTTRSTSERRCGARCGTRRWSWWAFIRGAIAGSSRRATPTCTCTCARRTGVCPATSRRFASRRARGSGCRWRAGARPRPRDASPRGLGAASGEARDVGKVPVPLARVEAVADHEGVGDLAAHVVELDLHRPRALLHEKGAHADRRGLARLEIAHEIGQAEPARAHALDDDHVLALDGIVQVLSDPYDPGSARRRPEA